MSEPTKLEKWQPKRDRVFDLYKESGLNYAQLNQLLVSARVGVNVSSEQVGHLLRPNGDRAPKSIDAFVNAASYAFAETFKARFPDENFSVIQDAFNRFIMGTDASPLSPSFVVKTKSKKAPVDQGRLRGVDLWTPGIAESDIRSELGSSVDEKVLDEVVLLSNQAIDAIASGDFERQRQIGLRTAEIGEHFPRTRILAEGKYLEAEALRLLADFNDDFGAATKLRTSSIEAYQEAIQSGLSDDARPLRGLSRTKEVMHSMSEALDGFEDALERVIAQELSPSGEIHRFSIAHERVRSLRHKLTALASVHQDTLAFGSTAARREDDLLSMLRESIDLHRQHLALFKDAGAWWQIEWFMAEVLHAKAWLALGKESEAAKHLLWALGQRLAMLEDGGELNGVELGNLTWWSATAWAARDGFNKHQLETIQQLMMLVRSGGPRSYAIALCNRIVDGGKPSWENKT
jgi:hypothetical protein